MAVVVLPPGIHMTLNPELCLLLFIAPLLFNDGKRTPRHELWNLRAPILMLALGLVFATVLIVGYMIHWMIPSIPLPAAFALAAILSPTDAVAVGAMAGRANLPKRIMRLLEGEALINDASGLVAFKFAIAAMVTGVFSLGNATLSFFIIAVAGGVVHAIERDRTESSSKMKLRIVSESTWSIILYILNGLVFVILGLQIPDVISVIFENKSFNNVQVTGYILIITAALIVLRFGWFFCIQEESGPLVKEKNLRNQH
jgi:NhaP-type Na+/H+ or K+/H+ antiporter